MTQRVAVQRIEIPYFPHKFQREIHDNVRFNRGDRRDAVKRFAFLVCHRRFGKTYALLNHLLRSALRFPAGGEGRFGYVAPFRNQAKLLAWDYLRRFTAPIPGVVARESELRFDLPNGARFTLFGADNPDAIRGAYFDAVGLDEFGQMYRRMWGEIVRPMLADREGAAIVSGTPKGKNAFYDMYQSVKDDPEWFVRVLRISETIGTPGLPISPEEHAKLLAEVALGRITQAEYDQEFECSWASAMRGSYFATDLETLEREGRIRNVPFDPIMPVVTAWDLGMHDQTVVWFAQASLSEVRVLRCMAWSGTSLPSIAKELHALPYTYSEHLLPHDVQVREQGTGLTRMEVLNSLGIHVRVMPRLSARVDYEEDERIQAIRQILPRTYFDAEGCREGLEALRAYRRMENKLGELGARPQHDWASDYADAFGLLAQGMYAAPHRPLAQVRVNPRWAAPT